MKGILLSLMHSLVRGLLFSLYLFERYIVSVFIAKIILNHSLNIGTAHSKSTATA